MVKRNWIDNLADLISGRVFNSIVSLKQSNRLLVDRINSLENQMSENEAKIVAAAQNIELVAQGINTSVQGVRTGIAALNERISQLEGVSSEDLRDELGQLNTALADLQSSANGLSSVGQMLAPTAPVEEPVVDGSVPVGGPINHPEPEVTELAGASGSTDTPAPPVEEVEETPAPVPFEDEDEDEDEVVPNEDNIPDLTTPEADPAPATEEAAPAPFEDEDEDEDEDLSPESPNESTEELPEEDANPVPAAPAFEDEEDVMEPEQAPAEAPVSEQAQPVSSQADGESDN